MVRIATVMRQLLLALLLWSTVASGEPAARPLRYKRFPETTSPDGAYALAWGHKLLPDEKPESLAEIAYQTPLDPAESEMQDYLVDLSRARGPLALTGCEYFSSAEGHEAKRGLSYAWSPDSSGVVALYESEEGYVAAVWAGTLERKVANIGKMIEKELSLLLAERLGPEQAATHRSVMFNRLAFLEPGLFTIDAGVIQPAPVPEKPVAFWFRLRWKIVSENGSVRAEPVSGRALQAAEPSSAEPLGKGLLDDQLDKALFDLRSKLGMPGRAALKQEQALWLKQRDGLVNHWNRVGSTNHRLEEIKIRAAETRFTP